MKILQNRYCIVKHFSFSLVLVFLLSVPLLAESQVDDAVNGLVADFSLEFREKHPDLVFKPNLAVLQITDRSEEAIRNSIGRSMQLIVEMKLQQSTIFNLVDQKKRDTLIKEINFALSGLSDTERLEPGLLKTVDYYLEGTVTEVGGKFKIFLRAIEVNTAEVVYSGAVDIDTDLMIERSQEIAAAYVSQYGIGIELAFTPFHYLYGGPAGIEGQPVPGESMVLGLDLNYRVNRRFLVWGSMEISAGGFRFQDTWEPGETYTPAQWANLGDPGAVDLIGKTDLYYSKDRTFWSAGIGAGYVFNFSRTFNITLGGQFMGGMHFLTQEYFMPNINTGTESVSNRITSSDAHTISIGPVLKLQYFVSPRLALNLRYSYMQVLSESEADLFYYSDVRYNTDDIIPALFDLQPSLDINGEEHLYSLSGHRISMGIGFYF